MTVLLSAFAASACAGGAGGAAASPVGTRAACVAAPPAGRATITARDDRFEPSCLRAAPHSTLQVVVRNAGHHPHNLTVAGTSGAHVAVDRGQTAFLTIGTGTTDVPFTCTIHPGMRGVIRTATSPPPSR